MLAPPAVQWVGFKLKTKDRGREAIEFLLALVLGRTAHKMGHGMPQCIARDRAVGRHNIFQRRIAVWHRVQNAA